MTRQEFIDQVNATILSGVAGMSRRPRSGPALINLARVYRLHEGRPGLSAVENTSDLAKPVSTTTVTALAGKVDKSRARDSRAKILPRGEDQALRHRDRRNG